MNLRRQLLLVSLLTLVLPWAGCQFVRETESALREGQQRMLAGTAQAIADSLSQFPSEFLSAGTDGAYRESQMYGHPLGNQPFIDGYIEDWSLDDGSVRTMRGIDGEIRYSLGSYRQHLYIFVEVRDASVVYSTPSSGSRETFAEQVNVVSVGADGQRNNFAFIPEAPGALIARRLRDGSSSEESRIQAHWQDTATGYRLETRIPWQLLGEYLGITVTNTRSADNPGIESSSFAHGSPGRLITESALLSSAVTAYVQPDLRLIITDRAGWRLARAGQLKGADAGDDAIGGASGWMRLAYSTVIGPGKQNAIAEFDPSGREQQAFVREALNANAAVAWFRSSTSGRAVVAVAQPVWSGNIQTGVLILQQGTDAILSLTNRALARLINFTLIATLGAVLALLGYASFLSLRIRRLSTAAEKALDDDATRLALPSALANDEIGDLSRSFTNVLRQLGDYNEYLRTVASKLSHELRTPLTIVNSSLENLEHEPLSAEAAKYTARARDGAQRLKNILSSMSESNRVEELMQNAEPEIFDIHKALASATTAYAGVWPKRRFRFDTKLQDARYAGSPEMIMQMLDKLVDNAVGFSNAENEIVIELTEDDSHYRISVFNPGPPLPERMRFQLFDSMVSVRKDDAGEHLGLGLHIAKLIVEGHGGTISAENTNEGVVFHALLPTSRAV